VTRLNPIPAYSHELKHSVRLLADLAFGEDLPQGDLTARALRLDQDRARARIKTRQHVRSCGALWYEELLASFTTFTPTADLHINCLLADGRDAEPGQCLFELQGRTDQILAIERTFLNFLGRALAIATKTRRFVTLVREAGFPTHILDTRKTLPGYRYFDKYAVLCGDGVNHRMSLSDEVMIKENHVAESGGMQATLEKVQYNLGYLPQYTVKVRNLDELKTAIAHACPVIMLDNFTPAMVHRACEIERGDCRLEVSGGIHEGNILQYCHPKLDRISIGSLTHSVKAPDITLLMEEEVSCQS